MTYVLHTEFKDFSPETLQNFHLNDIFEFCKAKRLKQQLIAFNNNKIMIIKWETHCASLQTIQYPCPFAAITISIWHG